MVIPMRILVVIAACRLFALPAAYPLPVTSVRGEVTHRISGCDYFLVETNGGYDLLEWYGGHDPDKGDILVGNFESYGFHDVLNETADESSHIYTEDFQMSKTSALENLTQKCE